MPCRRYQVNTSLSNLCFEFVALKTRPKVLLNASCDATKGVKKEDFRPTSRSTCRFCRKKKKRIRGYKIVDESVVAYSANGKDRPISEACHPGTYVARQVFFFFFLAFGLNLRPQVVFYFSKDAFKIILQLISSIDHSHCLHVQVHVSSESARDSITAKWNGHGFRSPGKTILVAMESSCKREYFVTSISARNTGT